MEENTQLPKEVVERIELEAKQYAFYNYVTAANGADFTNIETWPQYAQVAYYSIRHYMIGDLTCWPYLEKTIPVEYATQLHQANETIKVLTNDNNRLKGEVEGLKNAVEEASGYIEFLDVQNNRLRKMLSDICEKAGAGTEIEKMIVEFFKEINTERESAAGREDDWIDVNDSLPEESGRYWCYIEQLTDLGFSYFQWNCDYNSQLQRFSDMTLKNGERITHWRPLAKPPKFKQQKEK